MRGSREDNGADVGIVVVAVWMLVAGAWIAQSGGFAITIALILAGIVAVIVPIALMRHEAHTRNRSHTLHG